MDSNLNPEDHPKFKSLITPSNKSTQREASNTRRFPRDYTGMEETKNESMPPQ